jgi:hypothetical protein
MGVAEILLCWFGGVSTRTVALALGVTRPVAQGIVNDLIGEYGDCVSYDAKLREHVPVEERCARGGHDGIAIDAGDARSALRMILGAKSVSSYFGVPDPWDFVVIEDTTARISPLIDGDILAALLRCMRLRSACFLQYASRNRHSQRVISPHALFHASGRYYLRAWCHEKLEYRNFALARCVRAYQTGDDYVSGGNSEDAEWRRRLKLRFRLITEDPAEAEALRQEWDLSDDVLTIPEVREACAPFVRRRFLALDNSGKRIWVEM